MGEMRVMDRSGDIVIRWAVTDGESTKRAKKEWDGLKAVGYEFFAPAEGDMPPKRVKQWNPDRGLVIAAPGVQKIAKPKAGTKTGEPSKAMAGGPSVAQRGDELIVAR